MDVLYAWSTGWIPQGFKSLNSCAREWPLRECSPSTVEGFQFISVNKTPISIIQRWLKFRKKQASDYFKAKHLRSEHFKHGKPLSPPHLPQLRILLLESAVLRQSTNLTIQQELKYRLQHGSVLLNGSESLHKIISQWKLYLDKKNQSHRCNRNEIWKERKKNHP